MSTYVIAERISDAWIEVLDVVNRAESGTATHLMVTVTAPELGADPVVSAAVDNALVRAQKQSVLTVANTLFPSALYNDPGFSWSEDLAPDAVAVLDIAAAEPTAPTLRCCRP